MYQVVKYFDDHFSGVVSTHPTQADAQTACYAIKPGCYISYGVRKAPQDTMEQNGHIAQQTNGGAEPKLKMCEQCGVNPADLPSTKCCGCNSYSEHF